MAFSMFTKLWRQEVEDRMFNEPDQLQAFWDALQLLRSEEWVETHALAAAVTQPWRHANPDWYDAAALNDVGVLLGTGLLVFSTVPVGAAPGRDREVAANNDRLANLPSGFTADFIGGHGDDDGTFEWDHDIEINHRQQDDSMLSVTYPPWHLPLEVGHVEPETVIQHIRRSGGVARWPYRSEEIVLLISTGAWAGAQRDPGGNLIDGAPRGTRMAGRRVIDDLFP